MIPIILGPVTLLAPHILKRPILYICFFAYPTKLLSKSACSAPLVLNDANYTLYSTLLQVDYFDKKYGYLASVIC